MRILCMRERDIKAKPSATKSPPHQAPFAPQEELPQRAAALLHPAKCPALQPCTCRHHLTLWDIGAATAAAPLRLNAWQNPTWGHRRCSHHCAAASQCLAKCSALQPCVHRCHVMPGDIDAAAAAAPLHLDSWQNPSAAAMSAPPPGHAQGHRAAAS
jgi:hypothetical protein